MVSALPSYTSMSNAAVGNTVHNYDNVILNSVHEHDHYITEGNYKATCFDYRLVIFRPIFVN